MKASALLRPILAVLLVATPALVNHVLAEGPDCPNQVPREITCPDTAPLCIIQHGIPDVPPYVCSGSGAIRRVGNWDC